MIRQPSSINLFRRACVLFITLVLTLAFIQPGGAISVINRKISGTMPAFADVSDFKISPEGDYVVLAADRYTDGVTELFAVPLYGGSEPFRLNGSLVAGGTIDSSHFQISNVTRRVVYLADQQTLSRTELYSVPLTGGPWVKLNGTLPSGPGVHAFLVSPDGQTVVYQADQNGDGRFELYSVPITGGVTPVILHPPLQPGGAVRADFQISPNSAWVVYRAEQDTVAVPELYRVAIGGGTSARLNAGALIGYDVMGFKITPNSLGVVFTCDPGTNKLELYSKYINAAGGPYKLSNIAIDHGAVTDFEITPNSGRVVYAALQEASGLVEVFSNSILGADMHKLSGTLPAGVDDAGGIRITSNSLGAVYATIDENPSDPFALIEEVYSNYLTVDTPPFHVNAALVAGGSVEAFAIGNNDARVVYQADAEVLGKVQLYSVPITGLVEPALPIRLNGPLAVGGKVFNFLLAPNKFAVIYLARQDSLDYVELYSTTNLGGTPLKVNGPLVAGGNVQGAYEVTPDSKVVVYIADQEVNDKIELYISYLGWQVSLPLLTK